MSNNTLTVDVVLFRKRVTVLLDLMEAHWGLRPWLQHEPIWPFLEKAPKKIVNLVRYFYTTDNFHRQLGGPTTGPPKRHFDESPRALSPHPSPRGCCSHTALRPEDPHARRRAPTLGRKPPLRDAGRHPTAPLPRGRGRGEGGAPPRAGRTSDRPARAETGSDVPSDAPYIGGRPGVYGGVGGDGNNANDTTRVAFCSVGGGSGVGWRR